MTGDLLDRAALALAEPVSRRRALRRAAAYVVALGPLGALARASVARGATATGANAGACLDCVLANEARAAAGRQKCGEIIVASVLGAPVAGAAGAAGLAAGLGCLAGSFFPPAAAMCHAECQQPPPQPRPVNPGGAGALWVFPPLKKAPRKPKRKTKHPRPGTPSSGSGSGSSPSSPTGAGGPCDTCTQYCLPCGAVAAGFLCCAVPPKPDDPNPCCPKG